MNYWLIKSEADCYSIADLKRDKKTAWTGVRNYQARNFMRDMAVGDQVLYYHSGGTASAPTGIYGLAKVAKAAYPDPTQYEATSQYYDPKATLDKPIWHCVDMAYTATFADPVTLSEIKRDPVLAGMVVAQQGSRLSIQPVSKKHFEHIIKLGK